MMRWPKNDIVVAGLVLLFVLLVLCFAAQPLPAAPTAAPKQRPSNGFDEQQMYIMPIADAKQWTPTEWFWYTYGVYEALWFVSEQFAIRGNIWERDYVKSFTRYYMDGVRASGDTVKWNVQLAKVVKDASAKDAQHPVIYVVLCTTLER